MSCPGSPARPTGGGEEDGVLCLGIMGESQCDELFTKLFSSVRAALAAKDSGPKLISKFHHHEEKSCPGDNKDKGRRNPEECKTAALQLGGDHDDGCTTDRRAAVLGAARRGRAGRTSRCGTLGMAEQDSDSGASEGPLNAKQPGLLNSGIGGHARERAERRRHLGNNGDYAKLVQRAIREDAEKALRSLRHRRRRAAAARETGLTLITARHAAFVHAGNTALARAEADGLMKTRRLLHQGADATRRLQELLYECLGEYEKVRLNASGRRRTSVEACDSVLREMILDLRWARFCSRLEDDTFGLTKVLDLGNAAGGIPAAADPAAAAAHAMKTAPSRRGNAGRTANSSSLHVNTAASAIASRLEPLLKRAGAVCPRILRVIALYPRRVAAGGRGRESERGEIGCIVNDSLTTSDRRCEHGQQKPGVDTAAREVTAGKNPEGRDSNNVVVVAETNTPLGVSDVLRRAVLCGNRALRAALVADDAFPDLKSRQGSERVPENTIDAISDITAAAAAKAGRGRGIGGGNSEPLSDGQGRMVADFTGDAPSPRELPNVESCRIVDADPALLLSSSFLAWVLRPPFCGLDRAPLGNFARSQNGASSSINGDVRAGGDGGGTGSGEAPPGRSHAVNSNTMNAWADMLGQVERDEVGGGGREGHKVSGGNDGTGRTSWRANLTRDVAWLGTSPVGSRLYYCLEEAEWEASQHEKATKPKTSTATTTPASPPAAEPRVISEREGTCLPWNTEDCNSDEEDQGARRASAMMFARSVSEMLAEVYIREDRTKPVRASTVAEKQSSRRDKGVQRSKPRDSIVADCGGGGGIAVGPEAASWVVSGTVDEHRRQAHRCEHSNERKTEKQVLDAVGALPDVLLASVNVSREKKDSHVGMAGGGRADNTAAPRKTYASAASTNARRLRPKKGRSAAAVEDDLQGHIAQETETVILHFAPAHVLQLLGTPHCREFVESLPPTMRGKIRHTLAHDDAALGSRAARPPPIKRLYVPLGSPLSGAGFLPPARDPLTPNPGLQVLGDCEYDMAATLNAACLPDLTAASVEFTRGVSPRSSPSPLMGALLHPLPARAMRELLQVYVATIRRVSSSTASLNGDGLRPTSGLFFTSSPDTTFSPVAFRDVENQRRGEQDKGARNKAVHVEHRRRPRSTTSRSKSKPTSPSTLSASSPLPEESGEASLQLTARVDVGPLMLNDNGPSAAGRSEAASRSCNSGEEEQEDNGIQVDSCYNFRSGSSAAVPPSAVDVIPDSINLSEYDGVSMCRCSASMSCITTADADAIDGGFVRGDEPGVGTGNNSQKIRRKSSGGGSGGGGSDRRPRRIAKTCPDNQLLEHEDGTFGAIVSSLRAEYRRSYVAVLAPHLAPTLSTPAAAAAGNGYSTLMNGATGRGDGHDGPPDDLFSGASALFVQLEDAAVPATVRRRSTEKHDYHRSQHAGVGQDHDRVGGADASGKTARAAREGELPTVCLWRGCLANALFETPLCTVHAQQKEFLDAKAAKARSASEASRFLPPGTLGNTNKQRRSSLRKRRTGAGGLAAAAKTMSALSTALSGQGVQGVCAARRRGQDREDEVAAACAMSPLLSELFNGKLASTIGMFCHRAVAESRQQHGQRGRSVRRLSSKKNVEKDWTLMESWTTSDQQIVKMHAWVWPVRVRQVPRWARWADPREVEAADRKLESDVQWAEQVLKVEREVTTELRRLSGLGVYPEAELARIRQEHEKLTAEWRQAVGRPYGSFAIENTPDGERGIGEEEESCVESVARVSTRQPRGGDKPCLAPLASDDYSSSIVAPVRSRAVGTGYPSNSVRTSALEPRSDVVFDRIAGVAATPDGACKGTADVATTIAAKAGKRRASSQVRQQQAVNTGGTHGKWNCGGDGRQPSAEEGWSPQAREAAWSSPGVARREAEIELAFCEMKRTLLKRRRKEAELATTSSGTMVPPYESPSDAENAADQASHCFQRDLIRSPLAPSTSSTSSWSMALDVSGRGSSMTIGGTRYSIAAISTGAAADNSPSSPAGHQLVREQHRQRGRHQPPSSASSSLSSSSTSPGQKRRHANATAVDGSRLRTESLVRYSRNSHHDHVHQQQQQQQQQQLHRRRHSSPPHSQNAFSSDSLPLTARGVVAGRTTASRSCTFTCGGGPHGRFTSLSLGGHMGTGRQSGTKVMKVVKRDSVEGVFNKGAGIGVGGRRRASSLPRRRASTGGGGSGGGYGVGGGSMMPWGGGEGRKGFDAAPYQTTVLFRDR